jgi:tetratricopeptide (TPR) repeat protein
MKRSVSVVLAFLILAVFQISSASSMATTSAAHKSTTRITLSLPELSWALEVAETGFMLEEKEIAPSGDAARFLAVNKATGVTMSAFLEKAPGKGDSKECRNYYWTKAKNSPLKKEQIKLSEAGPIALVEYVVPDYLGTKVNQRNVNAYLSKDGYWIDVHLSITDHKSGANDRMQPILQNIRINVSYKPSASDFFAYGNLYFGRKDYMKAALQYEKALNLENKKPTFDRKMWIVLVDQLGMSYGIAGDLAKSKQLYEWAITKEPEYPMFFYNLACVYGEMGKADDALHNLLIANKFKNNMLPYESLPDPRTDSSFRECLKNKHFSAELHKMKW